jgi:RND superfamily putative drug exporter
MLPAGRRAKWLVFLTVIVIFGGVAGAFAGKFEGAQRNETSSFLPGGAESVKALQAVERYPGGEVAPAVVVYQRRSGLTARDRALIAADVRRLNRDRPPLVLPARAPGARVSASTPSRCSGTSTARCCCRRR